MWFVWKKVMIYIAVVAVGSVFGYRYWPDHAADAGQKLPVLNQAMQAMLDRETAAIVENNATPGAQSSGGFAQKAGGMGAEGGGMPVPDPTPAGTAAPDPGEHPESGAAQGGAATAGTAGGHSSTAASSAHPAAPRPQAHNAETAAPLQKVDINHASLQELVGLPGIGESKAEAIIAYRKLHGGFRTAAEIVNVKGIGPKTYEALKNLIEAN